jgi:hypothetical protein
VEPKRVFPCTESRLPRIATSQTDSALPKETPESTERELARIVLSKTESVDPNCTWSTTESDMLKNESCSCVMAMYTVGSPPVSDAKDSVPCL